MQNVICPLCNVVVDTIEDTETTNSRDFNRPTFQGFSWEVRDEETRELVQEARLHECAA